MAGSEEKRRKPSWLILSLGFGGLLICIVAAAVDTLVTLQRVRDTEAHARKAFVARLSGLDQIRAQIYLSGTYVRDLLLSPDPDTAKAQAGAPCHAETRNLPGPGCLRARTGAGGTRAVSRAAQADRRLLEGARCHRRMVAAGERPPAALVLL